MSMADSPPAPFTPVSSERDVAAIKLTRPLYRFDVPKKLWNNSTDGTAQFRQLGFVELTTNEELMVAESAGDNTAKLSFELMKWSLREINGIAVSVSDGTVDAYFLKAGPLVRALMVRAYTKLHRIEDEEAKDFLSSMKTVIK